MSESENNLSEKEAQNTQPEQSAQSEQPEQPVQPEQSAQSEQPEQPVQSERSTQPEELPFRVILASASPRRRQLLEEAGINFTIHVSEVDETLEPDLLADPPEAAKKLAERKAGAVVQSVLADPNITGMFMILGADTMVVKDADIFGKPKNLSDAKHMLRELSGSTHQVHTAVSIWMVAAPEPEKVSLGFRTFVDTSHVTFKELTDEQIADYLRKGESFDKAGAYAIQGEGAALVESYEGALDSIIGLPVQRLLKEFPDLAFSVK